jgi:hypothetical protein
MKWKIENDHYCAVSRASYEVLYHPLGRTDVDPSSLKGSMAFFPRLRRYLGYKRWQGEELPLYKAKHFSKTVWDVEVSRCWMMGAFSESLCIYSPLCILYHSFYFILSRVRRDEIGGNLRR